MESSGMKEIKPAYRRLKKKTKSFWVQAKSFQPGNLAEAYLFIVVWQIL